jgi:hypothetical protein
LRRPSLTASSAHPAIFAALLPPCFPGLRPGLEIEASTDPADPNAQQVRLESLDLEE